MSGIRIERSGRLAVLRMDKARGNAIDEAFVAEMATAVAEVGSDEAVRGVLLASAHPKLFCPGLDLVSLFAYDRPGMDRFMKAFSDMAIGLFALEKPLLAAISGHAVAGGCVLALTADHRVLRRGAQIGLNEVRVGVPLPWSVALLLRASVPAPALSRVALLGANFTDAEAVGLGLVHEVQEAEGFEAACLARLEEFADKDPAPFASPRPTSVPPPSPRCAPTKTHGAAISSSAWFSPESRERIHATIDALQKKT